MVKRNTPRQPQRIEGQIVAIARNMQSYLPQTKSWYAAMGKINSLTKELEKSKQFQFEAR